MLQRRDFLKLSGGGLFCAADAAQTKSNLLFILSGGWREQVLDDLRLPNLRQLSRQGARFGRFYTCSPRPAPSRAALITGRFPFACSVRRDGDRLPLDQPSIAGQLKRAGYRTGFIGEWRLDGTEEPGFVPPGPRRHGFEYWAAFNRGRRYFDSIYFRDTPEPIHHSGFEPDYQTDLAIEFMQQMRATPFFLFLAWGPPHPPLTPPPRAIRRYDPRAMRLHPNVPAEQEQTARSRYAAYYALCSALDDNVGRLLAALDNLQLAGNTMVVFTSDSGDLLGSQGLDGDDEPFEESVRVPLILRHPTAFASGRNNDALFCNVDLMPTLLGFCGIETSDAGQGQNLSGWIAGGQGAHPSESIYSVGALGTGEEWRMVVRGLDKLVVDRDLNIIALYNLGQDPFEMNNLAREPSQDLKRDELKALLKDWMRRTGDGMDPSGLKRRGR